MGGASTAYSIVLKSVRTKLLKPGASKLVQATWCKQPGASNLMQATCHLVQANWCKQTVSTRTPSFLFSIALGPLMGRLFTGFIRSQGLSFSYFRFVENYPNSVKNVIFIRGQKLLYSKMIRHQNSCFTWAVRAPLTRLY